MSISMIGGAVAELFWLVSLVGVIVLIWQYDLREQHRHP